MAEIATTAANAVTSLHQKIDSMVAGAASELPMSAEEQLASKKAGEEVQASIQGIIDHIHESLAKNRALDDSNSPSSNLPPQKPKQPAIDAHKAAVNLKNSTENQLTEIVDAGELLCMSIGTILQSFNDTLKLPDLDKFSGVLESVPIIGIQGSNVMYAAKVLDQQKIVLEWKILDALPPDQAPAGATTSLFAYSGKLYLAVGNRLYYKAVKDKNQPDVLKAATNDWANIFVKDWFPSQTQAPWQDNFRSLVTWVTLSASGQALDTYLVQIANDYTWSYHYGTIVDGQPINFNSMTFVGTQAYPNMPLLIKAAYSPDNYIWGYDASNMLWQIKPDFQAGKWSVESAEQFNDSIIDMTVIDIGVAVAKANGELWTRNSEPPEDPGSSDPKKNSVQIKWKIYDLLFKDMQVLGSASLPMVLDTLTLTTYLRAKYIDTQVTLLPTMRKIVFFSKSHQFYLADMISASNQYLAAGNDPEKQAIAEAAGRKAMPHAQLFGELIYKSVTSSANKVVDMTRDLKDIGASLEVQLQSIALSLTQLNETLKEQQAAFDKLTIGMWASIAATVVGIGMLIGAAILAATGIGAPVAIGLAVAGGMLLVGGLVAEGVIVSKRSQAAAAIAATKSAIDAQTERQTNLTNIKNNFTGINSNYEVLNKFWSDMKTNADNANLDFAIVGDLILQDPSTLQAAQASSKNIQTYFTEYINILGSQGIKESTESIASVQSLASDWHDQDVSTIYTNLNKATAELPSDARHQANHYAVESLMSAANEKLAQGDWSPYLSLLKKAKILHDLI